MSRNHRDLTPHFPELLRAFEQLNRSKLLKGNDYILDGEIVVMKNHLSNFSALQERISLGPVPSVMRKLPVRLYAFDLIYLGGYNLEALPLLQRKAILKVFFVFKSPILYTQHVGYRGKDALIKKAKKAGWEGVMAKAIDSRYYHRRTMDWLKIKWAKRQEFVIGGFTAPRGKRAGFGALLLGYYERGKLKYAGKVGTGYTEQLLASLYTQFKRLAIKKSPFQEWIDEKNITWIKPILSAEVKFTEWTPEGKLRHPSFVGMRIDKSAKQIVREDKS